MRQNTMRFSAVLVIALLSQFVFAYFISAQQLLPSEEKKTCLIGDVTGDGLVDEADITYLRLYIEGLVSKLPDTENYQKTADVNEDGGIDSYDLNKLIRDTKITYKYGDTNDDGIVDSADYSTLRRYLLGIIESMPAKNWKITGDVMRDGVIDSGDYNMLSRYLLGKINIIPVYPQTMFLPTPTPTLLETPTISRTGKLIWADMNNGVVGIKSNDTKIAFIVRAEGLESYIGYIVKVNGVPVDTVYEGLPDWSVFEVVSYEVIAKPTLTPTPTIPDYYSKETGTIVWVDSAKKRVGMKTKEKSILFYGDTKGIEAYVGKEATVLGRYANTVDRDYPDWQIFKIESYEVVAKPTLTPTPTIPNNYPKEIGTIVWVDSGKKRVGMKNGEKSILFYGDTKGIEEHVGKEVIVLGRYIKTIDRNYPGWQAFEVVSYEVLGIS